MNSTAASSLLSTPSLSYSTIKTFSLRQRNFTPLILSTMKHFFRPQLITPSLTPSNLDPSNLSVDHSFVVFCTHLSIRTLLWSQNYCTQKGRKKVFFFCFFASFSNVENLLLRCWSFTVYLVASPEARNGICICYCGGTHQFQSFNSLPYLVHCRQRVVARETSIIEWFWVGNGQECRNSFRSLPPLQ